MVPEKVEVPELGCPVMEEEFLLEHLKSGYEYWIIPETNQMKSIPVTLLEPTTTLHINCWFVAAQIVGCELYWFKRQMTQESNCV